LNEVEVLNGLILRHRLAADPNQLDEEAFLLAAALALHFEERDKSALRELLFNL